MRPFGKSTWKGPDKLVIGIDIGTTQSAVSYAHLYAGGPLELVRVGKWPGQPDQKGSTKIPSLLYYNERDEVMLCGAEANTADARDEATDSGWKLVKHFKLHLHPQELRTKHNLQVDRLAPITLTVEKIYADFLRYLVEHTRSFFESRTHEGAQIWSNLIHSADFVLAHPNAWGLVEQNVLRRAATQADLVSPASADSRIHFVSEGEASVHFCMVYADLASKFEVGTKFIVCDAGGSTVDTTAYTVRRRPPRLVLEETKASGCVQAGGIFVNQEVMRQLRAKFNQLQISRELVNDWLVAAEDDFESSLKQEFPRATGRHSITLDRPSYNNKTAEVKNGRLILSVETVESFFQPCVSLIKTAVEKQLDGFNAKHLLLVGGFGDSPYLQQQLQKYFGSKCEVTIVEDGTSKAVSDGAVIWKCSPAVNGRVARYSFGTSHNVSYHPEYPFHQGRDTQVSADGKVKVRNQWRSIVEQGTLLKGDVRKLCRAHYKTMEEARPMATFRRAFYSYPEKPIDGLFVFNNDGQTTLGVQRVCTVTADLSALVPTLRHGELGPYYRIEYYMGLTFDATELKAYIEWDENGVKRRGPATIVPEKFA